MRGQVLNFLACLVGAYLAAAELPASAKGPGRGGTPAAHYVDWGHIRRLTWGS